MTLEEAHVDSVVMFPLRYNNEVHGYIWATNFDTRDVMRRADEDMYRNKAQYYTEHPERRHR